MTLVEWRKKIEKALAQAEFENPSLEAKWLLEEALQQKITINPTYTPTPEEGARLQEWLSRRLKGEPLSRIRGIREFWSLPFYINEHTLDPRPETEHIIEGVLHWIEPGRALPWRILDLGTGSGCILISILHELKNATGVGIDLSLEAIDIARSNAVLNGVSDRAAFSQGNWGAGLTGPFDIIVSNPPYILLSERASLEKGVLDFDPSSALFAGVDGLDCYRIIVHDAKRLLSPHGLVVLEFGERQEHAVQSMFTALGFQTVFVLKDLAGIERIIGLTVSKTE